MADRSKEFSIIDQSALRLAKNITPDNPIRDPVYLHALPRNRVDQPGCFDREVIL